MEPRAGAQSAFVVKAFYKNGDSLVIAQREFRRGFGIHRNRALPSAHAIKTWVRNFESTGSTLKKKGGTVKTVRKPEYIAVVREVHTVLRVATSCHSGCLKPAFDGFYAKIFASTPTKFKLLHERDYANRVNFCQTFLQLINQNQELVNNLLMTDEAYFHLSGFVNKQNFHYGLPKTP
jgi:hypothetical protein